MNHHLTCWFFHSSRETDRRWWYDLVASRPYIRSPGIQLHVGSDAPLSTHYTLSIVPLDWSTSHVQWNRALLVAAPLGLLLLMVLGWQSTVAVPMSRMLVGIGAAVLLQFLGGSIHAAAVAVGAHLSNAERPWWLTWWGMVGSTPASRTVLELTQRRRLLEWEWPATTNSAHAGNIGSFVPAVQFAPVHADVPPRLPPPLLDPAVPAAADDALLDAALRLQDMLLPEWDVVCIPLAHAAIVGGLTAVLAAGWGRPDSVWALHAAASAAYRLGAGGHGDDGWKGYWQHAVALALRTVLVTGIVSFVYAPSMVPSEWRFRLWNVVWCYTLVDTLFLSLGIYCGLQEQTSVTLTAPVANARMHRVLQ